MQTGTKNFLHAQFADLGRYLNPGDLLVFNNTKVLPARLSGFKVLTGGAGEALVERILTDRRMLCQLKFSKAPGVGTRLRFVSNTDAVEAVVQSRRDGFFELEFFSKEQPLALLARFGRTPLPPYIDRPADEGDARYQTVYASEYGAVAAPTAGLHFSEDQIASLTEQGIHHCELTLHIGAGTFQPVRVQDIRQHKMHKERYEISSEVVTAIEHCHRDGGRVIAVGTTSVRALEAVAASQGELMPWSGETDIFIHPPYRFRVVDGMITNFHMPESTLLMLICAFAGFEPVQVAYSEAVTEGYRFLSYGDAMLILPDMPSNA